MTESVIRRRFRVVGRVQNVGFRWWTTRQARRLGLAGTVQNRADGSVEVVATGPAGAVDRLAALLASGPAGAHVEVVEELEPPNDAGFSTFEILA